MLTKKMKPDEVEKLIRQALMQDGLKVAGTIRFETANRTDTFDRAIGHEFDGAECEVEIVKDTARYGFGQLDK